MFLQKMLFGKEKKAALLKAAVVSHPGRLRENNEDNFLLNGSWNRTSADLQECGCELPLKGGSRIFAAVFDGMGGCEFGEEASRLAAETFAAELTEKVTEPPSAARKAFLLANRNIREQLGERVGTTGTLLCADRGSCRVYHVGDSRAYRLRGGYLQQLTRDQTLAEMKIEAGFYDRNSPQAARDQHKLTEFIGVDPTSETLCPQHWGPAELLAGDRYLLCSDGLYDMCCGEQITAILLQEKDPLQCARALVTAANDNGGCDNVTCMVLDFLEK